LEAIEEALKSRVPDSSGGCSSKDCLEPTKKSDRQFRHSRPAEKFTLPRKRKQEEVAEIESDDCSIATDSTRTLVRKIVRAPWTLIRSFSRDQHSDAELGNQGMDGSQCQINTGSSWSADIFVDGRSKGIWTALSTCVILISLSLDLA
jgi:hypothetical protein